MKEQNVRTINLTPTPAEHSRLMARMVDGQSPKNYVSEELRRIAGLYEEAGLTWDSFNSMLNGLSSLRAVLKELDEIEMCGCMHEEEGGMDPMHKASILKAKELMEEVLGK